MEVNTQRRQQGLKEKIPDIQKTLDTVRFLKTRKVSLAYCLVSWLFADSIAGPARV